MEIRWDMFAALVALCVLPFMLSPSATWLIKSLCLRVGRKLWPACAECERLEWRDIPDDPLACPTSHHYSENCLDSSVGTFFYNAWISANRRERPRVSKPSQLDFHKSYIRTDPTTLGAFALQALAYPLDFDNEEEWWAVRTENRPSPITFENVGGIMTAHLCHMHLSTTPKSKKELKSLLKGYPPFYSEFIYLPNGEKIWSPIQSSNDIDRGGWIVAAGLNYDLPPKKKSHIMLCHTLQHITIDINRENSYIWEYTTMRASITRVGDTLAQIQKALPHDPRPVCVLEIYNRIFKKMFALRCVQPVHGLKERECGALGFTGGGWADLLTAEQWRRAMAIFNHVEPLAPDEKDLLDTHMTPIFHAVLVGLLEVAFYGSDRSPSRAVGVRKLPQFPEIFNHRHIYLKNCEIEHE